MDLPHKLSWLSSRRFLRALGPLAFLVLVATVLYNATFIDRVPPTYQIKLSSTEPNGGLAMTLTTIDVVFSKPVRHDTAQTAFSISPPVQGAYQWQGTILIFVPSAKLPLATTFTVHMAPGVQDLPGNVQGKSKDLTFTTVGAPTVTSVVPASGSAGVPVDSTIEITFDRLMDTDKVLAGLKIEPALRTWPPGTVRG